MSLKCNLCDFKADSELKLSKHIQHTHKLKKIDYLIQIKYNGIHPTCGCGCGEKMRYEANIADFCKFKHGHQSRLKGHWGDPKSEKRVNAIIKTRKEKFASGEYDHIKEAVKKNRKDPSLGKKISKGAKGIPKPKPEGFGVGRIQSDETKEKMSGSHKINWENGNIGKKHYSSKLENKFEDNILKPLNIEYKKFFKIKSFKYFYDFYIPQYNIIIEVDGDFFHSNPKFYPNGPIYKTQIENNLRDQLKTQAALNNGYKLLRFWESDINNNILEVKKILLENCKS